MSVPTISNAGARANRLEAYYAQLPGIVQQVLHEPFVWCDEQLKAIAGDPQAVIDSGLFLADLGRQALAVAQEDHAQAVALGADWSGDAYEAFLARIGQLDETIAGAAAQLQAMPEVCYAAAEALTEGADLVVDIVVTLVTLVIGYYLTAAALAVLTAGASVAAATAASLATAAEKLAEVARVVEKVAEVLVKVAEVLRKIATLLEALSAQLATARAALAEAKAATKLVPLTGAQLGDKVTFGVMKTLLNLEIRGLTAGQVVIPGAVGPVVHAFGDGAAADDAADRAVAAADAARQAPPPPLPPPPP